MLQSYLVGKLGHRKSGWRGFTIHPPLPQKKASEHGGFIGRFFYLKLMGVLGKNMPSGKCDRFVLDGPGDQRFGTE